MRGARAKAIRNMLDYDIKAWRQLPIEDRYHVDTSTGTLYCRGKRRDYTIFKRIRRKLHHVQ